MERPLIYLDNAATSFPKPGELLDEMISTYARLGVSPGRGSYDLAMEAADYVMCVRQRLAEFFGAPDPERVVFAANATDALNVAIQGLVGPGDHVVSTRLEHNSVLRPLFHLKERGWIDYDLAGFGALGVVDPEEIRGLLRPNTRLVVVCHGSQVLGTVQPIAEIAQICRERCIPLLVDAAQTAGQIPIDLEKLGVDAMAFTGHKALLGPPGTGGLVVTPDLDIKSTRFGGTGVDSHSLRHTQSFPYRLEAGTLNMLGIIGLSVGLEFVQHKGVERTHSREMGLIRRLREGLSVLPGVTVYSPPPRDGDLPVLTCGIAGLITDDVGAILDGDYRIAVRTGLHCAPLAHADLGTGEQGSIRFSLGHLNTEADIDAALEAMAAIAGSVGARA